MMKSTSLHKSLIAAMAAFAVALSGAVPFSKADAAERRAGPGLVVVELYTSQSCNSCPPADAFLGELARRKDVLALSMHVDYWNGLGWRDHFSSPDITARQKDYMRSLGTRYVSTPQAIIQGRSYAVGSDRSGIPRLIEQAKGAAGPRVQPRITVGAGDRLTVNLPETKLPNAAAVWFVAFDDKHTVPITSGENSGATITYTNVVRDLRRVGTWDGRPKAFEIDVSEHRKSGFGNCAVLIQSRSTGPILGAASVPMAAAGH